MNHSSFTGNTHLDEQQRAAAADCSGSSLLLCARHGASLTGESPVTGIYRQV